MLYLIPAPAHRIILRLAHRTRLRWWRIRKPRLAGCRVLAIDSAGRVLLVRHSYGRANGCCRAAGLSGAKMPSLRPGANCLRRPAALWSGPSHLELAEELLHGAENAVNVIAGLTHDTPLADGREIIEAAFFAANALPEQMPRTVPRQAARLDHSSDSWPS